MKATYTEKEFTGQVLQLAKVLGWRSAHFRPARTAQGWRTAVQGDGKGWLDLLLIRRASVIVAELKVGKRQLTEEQAAWIRAWDEAMVPWYLWTPADWPEIERILREE